MLKKIRLYYTGGLISLILLPFLCITFIYKSNSFKKYYAFDIIRYRDEWFKNNPELKVEFPPKRNFKIIELSGNEIKAKLQLDEVKLTIRNLILRKDSLNGIIVRFTDQTKYWSFVKALDLCKSEDITTYALYYDDLYIYEQPLTRIPVKNNIETFTCDYPITTSKPEELSFFQSLKTDNKLWIILIAFILLSFLSINRIYEKGNR